MPDWWNPLWGNSPPPSPPRHPSSRGAILGMNYRALPDMKAPIEDQRGNIPDTLPPLWGEAAENAEILSRYPPGSHVLASDAYDWREKHMPGDLPTTPLPDVAPVNPDPFPPHIPGVFSGGRVGFADGGAPDPLDGWTAEPVDHDPFAAPHDPTARPSGWWNSLFGEPERHAAQPQSRGAMLGLGGYQNMPDTHMSIDDQRGVTDQAFWMKNYLGDETAANYPPSMSGLPPGRGNLNPGGPTETVGPLTGDWGDPSDVAPYTPSFKQNFTRNTGQAPYRRFEVGPNLPHGPQGTSRDPEMPYMGSHLPIAPGDPGWTPPPSRSGPHNRKGDPDRPGYGRPPSALDIGRMGFADGGVLTDDNTVWPEDQAVHPSLEPVDHDPFPPAPQVQQSDINRAKGFPEPRSPMHDRIAAASQDIPYTPEDIDQPGPMTETLAHYAGNPEHAMPMRIGAAIGEEAKRAGQGLWSAATLPGDIATGKTTMEDPEAQRREMDLAAGVTLTPAGEVPEGALSAGMRRRVVRRPGAEMPTETTEFGEPEWARREPAAAPKGKAAKAPPPPGAELSTDAEKLSMIGHNKGPSIEQPMVNQALPSFDHPDFPEGRIATSVPTSVAREAASHDNNSLQIGMDLARENPETYRKNADVIRGYDWLRIPEGASDHEVHEALINHAQSNLTALYDAIHPDIRPTSSLWYDGAKQINNGMAHEYGRRPENIAGLVAALSPQRDWFMNVENARRVADVLHHQAEMPVSAAMEQWGRNYANGRNPTGRVTPDMVNAQIDGMIGKPLSEMTPIDKAFYVRMYDAAHGPHPSRVPIDAEGNPHPEGYYILNPDGSSTGRVARTNDNSVKRLTWGSGGQLANAIRAFEANDMPTISRAMGNRHKVRNFYNNNMAPDSASGATTIDTHAIAASLLQPLGASAPEVEHGLGMKGSKFNGNGSSGLYPNYFEAYRRAAEAISKRPGGPRVLPRQLQSITWEGIRGLFNPQERSSSAFIEGIKALWRAYKRGRMSLQNVLQRIMTNPATGESRIRDPQWVTGDDRVEDEGGE